MKKEEIDHIGMNLFKETQERKKSGKWTDNDLILETNLYKELNELGFNFTWHMQLSPLKFTQDNKEIVDIFTKYFGKFDAEGLKSICIQCLGVKGLTNATPFLLKQYSFYVDKDNDTFNSICNAIYRIRDRNYIEEYIKIISDRDKIKGSTALIVDLLGILKAEKAVHKIVELLDYVIPYEDGIGINAVRFASILAIGKFKNPENIKYVERFLSDTHPVARENAVKSIKKMGGRIEKIKDQTGKNVFILIKD